MDSKQWEEYINSRPDLKKCILNKAPKWRSNLGGSVSSLYQTLSQRVHPIGHTPDEYNRKDEVLQIYKNGFTGEQILVIACILDYHYYPVRIHGEDANFSCRATAGERVAAEQAGDQEKSEQNRRRAT